jgi:hypothetical protein
MTSLSTLQRVAALALLGLMSACDSAESSEKTLAAAARETQALAASAPVVVAAKQARVALPATTVAVLGVPVQLAAKLLDKPEAGAAEPTLRWISADHDIATVDATGKVSPLRAGVTRITAALGDAYAATTLSVSGPTPIPPRSRYVGTNLGGVAYFSSQFPFANMLKSSEGWGSKGPSGSPGGPFLSMTPDGYPAALKPNHSAIAAVGWVNAHYPAGRYVVLWDGDGALSIGGNPGKVALTSANRMTLDVTDTTTPLFVSIDRTNPANPVRNVRFLWPGTEATYKTQPFTPEFLQRLAPFSVLRFMDWGATNGSPIVNWADRPLPTDLAWSGPRGVPLEAMIELANSLHVDPWFCVPHLASDDYVLRFAKLVHEKLDPSLRPHIEYSNEVWNGGFAQSKWAAQQADALGLPKPSGMGANYYAQRSVQVFKLAQQAFGPKDQGRIVRVIAGQSAWGAFQEAALAWKDTAANTDVLAIAPYFTAGNLNDPAQADATLALSPDQLVDRMMADVRGGMKTQMTANAALAKKYKLVLKAYESGPGDTTFAIPDAKGDAVTALVGAANRSPRMREVYTEFYSQWVAAGGSTMLQFNDISGWGKFGNWGALEYLTQDPATSPKYRALLDFIAAHPTPP